MINSSVVFGAIGSLSAFVAILVVVVNWAISAGVIKQKLTSIECYVGQIQNDITDVKIDVKKAHARLDEHIEDHLKHRV